MKSTVLIFGSLTQDCDPHPATHDAVPLLLGWSGPVSTTANMMFSYKARPDQVVSGWTLKNSNQRLAQSIKEI